MSPAAALLQGAAAFLLAALAYAALTRLAALPVVQHAAARVEYRARRALSRTPAAGCDVCLSLRWEPCDAYCPDARTPWQHGADAELDAALAALRPLVRAEAPRPGRVWL